MDKKLKHFKLIFINQNRIVNDFFYLETTCFIFDIKKLKINYFDLK